VNADLLLGFADTAVLASKHKLAQVRWRLMRTLERVANKEAGDDARLRLALPGIQNVCMYFLSM
jgi:hypothetical protein